MCNQKRYIDINLVNNLQYLRAQIASELICNVEDIEITIPNSSNPIVRQELLFTYKNNGLVVTYETYIQSINTYNLQIEEELKTLNLVAKNIALHFYTLISQVKNYNFENQICNMNHNNMRFIK